MALTALGFVVLAFVFQLLDGFSHQGDLILEGSDCRLPVLDFLEVSV